MKYRPNYPGAFAGIEQARAHVDRYVPWYNQHHKHSGIALFSPNDVHDGSWEQLWARRARPAGLLRNSTPSGSAPARPPRHRPASSASTSPPTRPPKPTPNDSTQLDNDLLRRVKRLSAFRPGVAGR